MLLEKECANVTLKANKHFLKPSVEKQTNR